jgi:hypothetical protein
MVGPPQPRWLIPKVMSQQLRKPDRVGAEFLAVYTLREVLGEGTFGRVRSAVRCRDKFPVAIKELCRSLDPTPRSPRPPKTTRPKTHHRSLVRTHNTQPTQHTHTTNTHAHTNTHKNTHTRSRTHNHGHAYPHTTYTFPRCTRQ